MQYYSTLKAKLIYIFTIGDEAHKGLVKIGEATLDEATNLTLAPNSKELNAAARKRIDQYTKTAGIDYTLRYTELTVSIKGGQIQTFNDKEVHDVLLRSGIKRHDFSSKHQGREWFECNLETAIEAIQAVKEGRHSINPGKFAAVPDVIEFRPEQKEAIEKTVRKFSNNGKNMLWNAKMRFGKTLSALQVVKEMRFHRTIIVTHRPVVDEGWFEDFGKIFNWMDPWTYGSRDKGEPFEVMEGIAKKNPDQHYVWFASMQDLRGAQEVGGKFNKNKNILAADYDLVIIDEAHEGTQTELGQNVLKKLQKEKTHVLNLSGTPFNLMDDFGEDEIFTWDYTMEQKAKLEWDLNHFGDPNPYAGLPRLNIFTFDLGKALAGFEDIEDSAFNFKEFFRTWTGDPEKDHREMPEGALGTFIHEESVKNFLNLIVKYDPESNYPFSTPEFRNSFRHTLWMVPGVKEARALSALLKQHNIFSQFEIVNVAGDGDEEVETDDALKMVNKAMGDDPEDTRTITLSCGKLTTGVTVRPWTAVMMLAGSHNTDAKAYMQTIFRVQSPYTTNDGRRKENCYVFDFAPDRTLKVLADTAKVQTKKTASENDRVKLGEFLNFCPVIGYNGTKMANYNVDSMLEQLKRAYITRITKNGCDDVHLYNQEMLRKLDENALAKFKDLYKIIGSTKENHASTDVDMAKTGLTNEQYKELERIKKKKKAELTEEEKRKLAEAKEKKDNADAAISILRGISIRLPLLMYGAELTNEGQDITLDNFVDLIDDASWAEFMPRGVTKELFKDFQEYYDPDMFRAVSRNYRDLVRAADKLAPKERTREIAQIFSYFRNPDKETVLTPWRVVNLHVGNSLGGHVFFKDDYQIECADPVCIDQGEVTETVFKDPNTRILEINSKTGLYPLFMAYSVFAEKLRVYRDSHMLATEVPLDIQNQIWDDVLKNNIYVISKTKMATYITRRTLAGFKNVGQLHIKDEQLVTRVSSDQKSLVKDICSRSYWEKTTNKEVMKFNAVVGNPPYQEASAVNNRQNPIYHYFYDLAALLSDVYTLITPARFLFNAGLTPEDWNKKMLNNEHIKVVYYTSDSSVCFPNVDIKGGVVIILGNAKEKYKPIHKFIPNDTLSSIASKFTNDPEHNLPKIIFGGRSDLKFNHTFLRAYPHTKEDRLAFIQIKRPSVKKLGANEEYELKSSTFEALPYVFKEAVTNEDEYYHLLGLVKAKREWRYIEKRFMTPRYPRNNNIDKYKVFIPKANGGGVLGEQLSKDEIGHPGDSATSTFISIGAFNTIEEAKNCSLYLKTKFLRCLLGILKITQDNPPSVWGYIPMQDFTSKSDLNWDCSISELDQQLYKKYGLTADEISFIEKEVVPMKEDSLFDSEELIDPNFGYFDLEEYGVKPGDKIIYTPANIELTVAEGNMVIYGGETLSLPVFTAKYMPRNRRSISGVCQGPKYFSHKGISLYKLKESFLGGQK